MPRSASMLMILRGVLLTLSTVSSRIRGEPLFIVVDTLADPVENLLGTNPCALPHKDVQCSLRLAIDMANSKQQPP